MIKKVAKIEIIEILFLLSIFSCSGFSRNPNLSLFLNRDADSSFFKSSLIFPSFSQNGNSIYFLEASDDYLNSYCANIFWGEDTIGGNLYKINSDGTGLTLVREGYKVRNYAVSPDNKKIVFLEDGIIKIMEINGSNIETLPIFASEHGFAFSSDGLWLYYFYQDSCYKLNLQTKEIIYLFNLRMDLGINGYGLTLSPGDSMLLIGEYLITLKDFSKFEIAYPEDEPPPVYPKFSPIYSNLICFPKSYLPERYNDLLLFDLKTGKIESLNATISDRNSVILHPSWHPNGKRIIFSATDLIYHGGNAFSLWILDLENEKE